MCTIVITTFSWVLVANFLGRFLAFLCWDILAMGTRNILAVLFWFLTASLLDLLLPSWFFNFLANFDRLLMTSLFSHIFTNILWYFVAIVFYELFDNFVVGVLIANFAILLILFSAFFHIHCFTFFLMFDFTNFTLVRDFLTSIRYVVTNIFIVRRTFSFIRGATILVILSRTSIFVRVVTLWNINCGTKLARWIVSRG